MRPPPSVCFPLRASTASSRILRLAAFAIARRPRHPTLIRSSRRPGRRDHMRGQAITRLGRGARVLAVESNHAENQGQRDRIHETSRPSRRAPACARVALRKQARRRVRRSGAAKAIMRSAPGRPDRRDSDVAKALVSVIAAEN
jgi:hypothetical protein